MPKPPESSKSVWTRNNVKVFGSGTVPLVFAHGYGCDQNMWRLITPAFEKNYKIVLFDHVGFGKSDLSAFDAVKYSQLDGFAQDLLEICHQLNLQNVIFIGHSVSAMIGILAAIQEPALFQKLIHIGPSPCYINDGDYVGGFNRSDIEGLLEFLDSNYLGWSNTMAPVIMGNADRPELTEELSNSFCRTDPEIGKHFARVTFLSDNRADLSRLKVPSLILQCQQDMIAPPVVGAYVHEHTANSTMVLLNATGHCPHLSAPQETIAAMIKYLGEPSQPD